MRGWGRAGGAVAAAGVLWLPTVGSAQERATPDSAEVTVTAQGRAEARRDVPLSLQSFTTAELRALDIRDVRDLSAFVPGLLVETQYPSTPTIVIRGIATDSPDATAEPRVSVYQDGVYVSRPQSALFEFFDLERVEVIKGPQSTLFGRAALTGAISIVQNKADPSALGARVRVGAGTLEDHVVDAMVNVPLTEHIAVRVAGIARDRDGYVDNLSGGPKLNADRTEAVRGSLRIETAAGGTIDLIGSVQHDRFTGNSYKSGVFAPTNPATGMALGDRAPYTATYLTAAADFPRGGLGGTRSLGGVTLLVEQPLGERLSLTGNAAWTRYRVGFVGDFDGTSLNLATLGENTRGHQLSAEMRLRYTASDTLSGSIGASIAEERNTQDILIELDEREVLGLQTGLIDRTSSTLLPEATYQSPVLVARELAGIAAAYGAPLAPALASAIAANFSGTHLEELARSERALFPELFGSLDWTPTPRLTVEAGLRYALADKTSGQVTSVAQRSILAGFIGALGQPAAVRTALLNALAAPGAATIPTSATYPLPQFGLLYQPSAGEERSSLTRGGFAWRLSARYAATPALNLYATYARGRRPDVVSPQPPLAPGGATRFTDLAAENVDSVEAGAKYSAAGLEASGALFAYDYRHFQTEVLQGTTLLSLDAGKARAWGGEASLRYHVVAPLSVFATYGYTHARFGTGLYDGKHFRLSPDHTASAGATLTFRVPGGRADATPSIDWRSRIYFDDSNGDLSAIAGAFLLPLPFQASQAPYARANLHLGYAPSRGTWRIDAVANNLFDKRYLRDIGSGSVSIGLPSYIAAPPRSVELTFTLQFGH